MHQIEPDPRDLPLKVKVCLIKGTDPFEEPNEDDIIDIDEEFEIRQNETVQSLIDQVKEAFEEEDDKLLQVNQVVRVAAIGPELSLAHFLLNISNPEELDPDIDLSKAGKSGMRHGLSVNDTF